MQTNDIASPTQLHILLPYDNVVWPIIDPLHLRILHSSNTSMMDAISTQFKGASVLELREIIDAVGAICPEGRERASTLYRDLAPELKKNRTALESIVRSLSQTCQKCKGVIDTWKAGDDAWKTAVDVQNVAGFRSIFTGRKPPGYLGMPGSSNSTPTVKVEREVLVGSKERPVSYDGAKVWDWSEPRNNMPGPPPGPPPLFPNLLPSLLDPSKSQSSSSPRTGENGTPTGAGKERRPYDNPRRSSSATKKEEPRMKDLAAGRVITTVRPNVGERVRCQLCSDVCIVDDDTFSFEALEEEAIYPVCRRCLEQRRLHCEACCKSFFGTRDLGIAIKCRDCLEFEAKHTICEVCFEWTAPEKCLYGQGIEGHLEDPVCDDCVQKDRAKRRDRKDVKKKRRVMRNQEPNGAGNVESPSFQGMQDLERPI